MEGKKILVVDDDRAILELLKVNLEYAGYQVCTAEDGAGVVELAREIKPDLIILDKMLPRTDGCEVCHLLRQNESTLLTPIIILSALDSPLDKISCLNMGADDYLTKPFDVRELLARIDSRFKRTRQMLSASPLTRLPGNESIRLEVYRRLQKGEKFAFLYLDIDNFKAYNDTYGFARGDTVIRALAEILKAAAGPGDFVGHVGGDDFIFITGVGGAEAAAQKVIDAFAAHVPSLYREEDRKQGYLAARDRQGQERHFPLMTLSIGLVTSEQEDLNHYGKIVAVATEMKKFAKEHKRGSASSIAVNQRREKKG